MTAKGPSMAEMIATANELAARWVSGSSHLTLVSDRSERDARIEEAQRKIEAALLFCRNGKINLAKHATDEAYRLLKRVKDIGFDPIEDEEFSNG